MSKVVNFVLPEDFILRRVFIFIVLLGMSALLYFRASEQEIHSVISVFVPIVLFVPLYHLWQKFVFPMSLALFFFWVVAAINESRPFISAEGTDYLSTAAVTVFSLVFLRFIVYMFFETSP